MLYDIILYYIVIYIVYYTLLYSAPRSPPRSLLRSLARPSLAHRSPLARATFARAPPSLARGEGEGGGAQRSPIPVQWPPNLEGAERSEGRPRSPAGSLGGSVPRVVQFSVNRSDEGFAEFPGV